MGRVAVVGESIMDVVDGLPIPGGSAANVALGLARRGIDTTFATYLADDEFGRQILTRLRGAGVHIAPGSVSGSRTSSATASTGPDGDVSYTFDLGWHTPELAVLGDLDVLHIGSVPALSDAGRSRLMDRIKSGRQRCITYDPNIRPALAPPHDLALDHALEIASTASIVKLSDQDAAWLFPSQSLEEVIETLILAGTQLVVLTLGSEGLTMASAAAVAHIPAVPVEVSDTIGAGDTVMAALIAAELEGPSVSWDNEELERVGTAAVAAAAITVTRRGADMPTLTDLVGAGVPSLEGRTQ